LDRRSGPAEYFRAKKGRLAKRQGSADLRYIPLDEGQQAMDNDHEV